jgi:hypothetical protein
MTEPMSSARCHGGESRASARPSRNCNLALLFKRTSRDKRFFAAGGRRNRLKRLIFDKEIQGNPSQKFCLSLLGFSPGLARLG